MIHLVATNYNEGGKQSQPSKLSIVRLDILQKGENQYQIVGPYKQKWVFFQNIFSQMVHIIST